MLLDPRIDEIETCDDLTGVTLMVHLKDGFCLDGAHSFGEDVQKLVKTTMQRVRACECDECKGATP